MDTSVADQTIARNRVERVIDILSIQLTPHEIGQWMKAKHPALGCTPAEALAQNRIGDVVGLANRFVEALAGL